MKAPSWISQNLNIPTLIALGGVVFMLVQQWSELRFQQAADERYRIERGAEINSKFDVIEKRVAEYAAQNVPYRVTVVEQELKAANQRIDRFSETLLTSIDMLRKEVNGLSTRIEVLTQRVDTIAPRRATNEGKSSVRRAADARGVVPDPALTDAVEPN